MILGSSLNPRAMASHRIPRLLQGATDPTRPILATGGPMDLLALPKHRRRWLSPASSALHKPIIPTATHLQHGTEQPYWIRLTLRVNEGISHGLCLEKKAVVFF